MSHLPPLMNDQEFRDRAGRGSRAFNPDELSQFQAFAADASTQIRQVAEDDFMTDDIPPVPAVPDGVLPVMFRVILRAMQNPLGLTMEVDGTYTAQKAGLSGGHAGVYLTDEDRSDIRRALTPKDTGFVAVTMSNFPLPEVTS